MDSLPVLSPYAALYGRVTGRETPQTVVHRDSDADVLSAARGFIGAFDYTLQLQVGCPGGCMYCYVPASTRLTPTDMQRNWGFEVRTKRRAVAKFRRHLEAGRLADSTVYWSGVTDPYAGPPKLTRSIWQTLNDASAQLRPRRLAVQSRFAVDCDISPIAEYCQSTTPSDRGPAVVVSYSIGTDRTDIIRLWERATPSFERRLKTVERLCRAGLFVDVTLSPFGPWHDLRGTLQTLNACGVRYVTVIFFKLEHHCAATPGPFLEYLRREWPELLDPTWQAERLAEIRAVFGPRRVLLERAGFSSLAAPQQIHK